MIAKRQNRKENFDFGRFKYHRNPTTPHSASPYVEFTSGRISRMPKIENSFTKKETLDSTPFYPKFSIFVHNKPEINSLDKKPLLNNFIINKSIKNILLILILLLISTLVVAIPDTLTLQGKLTNLNGKAQVGTFNFTFKIYDVYTGGTALYQTDTNITTDANGIYDVILQDLSSLNFSDQYFLGITVSNDDESQPRINLTSTPYSFRANVSEDLNKENSYTVAVFNITGNLTIGESFADVLTVTTGRLNISDGSITAAGNLTLGQRITFSLGQIIDNLVSGFIRVTGGLNVTESLVVLGNISLGDTGNDTITITSDRFNVSSGNLDIAGGIEAGGGLNVSGDFSIAKQFNVSAISGEIKTAGNLTLQDKITFRLGEIIDNIVDGWIKLIGSANITESLVVEGGANITGDVRINQQLNINAASGNLVTAGTIGVSGTGDSYILGNVGIGTTTPGMRLDVVGNVSISGNLSVGGNFSVDGSTLFVDTNSNAVGIGTSSPATLLYISGVNTAISTTIIGEVSITTDRGSVPQLQLIDAGTSGSTFTIGSGISGIGTFGIRDLTASGSPIRFTIDSSGNVGIGTITPQQKLEVSGNILVNNTASAFINLSGPIIRKSGNDIVISD